LSGCSAQVKCEEIAVACIGTRDDVQIARTKGLRSCIVIKAIVKSSERRGSCARRNCARDYCGQNSCDTEFGVRRQNICAERGLD
jgi:hypothetical protein